jgi:hypothetical protein
MRKDFSNIAKDLKLPEAVPQIVHKAKNLYAEDAVIAAVKRWSKSQEGDLLLIIDNADNLTEP